MAQTLIPNYYYDILVDNPHGIDIPDYYPETTKKLQVVINDTGCNENMLMLLYNDDDGYIIIIIAELDCDDVDDNEAIVLTRLDGLETIEAAEEAAWKWLEFYKPNNKRSNW